MATYKARSAYCHHHVTLHLDKFSKVSLRLLLWYDVISVSSYYNNFIFTAEAERKCPNWRLRENTHFDGGEYVGTRANPDACKQACFDMSVNCQAAEYDVATKGCWYFPLGWDGPEEKLGRDVFQLLERCEIGTSAFYILKSS